METYLNSSIKEVIDRFPEVGRILDECGVGCVACSVGTCLLKDIIAIHDLSEANEQAVMSRIAEAIHPGKKVTLPKIVRKATASGAAAVTEPGGTPTPAALRYSPPLKQLVDEHVLIKRWLALIPEVLKGLDLESPEERQLVLDGVDFIRTYADKLHHAKEEDILFKYFDEDQAILKVMLADHERAREHARATEEGVHAGDRDKVAHHLTAYRELLCEHIKKEDEILYRWMDRDLTTTQVGELFARFETVNDQMGAAVSERNSQFVTRAEEFVSKKRQEETP